MDSSFFAAVQAMMDDHERYGGMGDEGFNESGDLRVVGIARADVMRLLNHLHDEYGPDFSEGGPPMATALLCVMEMCLSVGVHLERARWQEMVDEVLSVG